MVWLEPCVAEITLFVFDRRGGPAGRAGDNTFPTHNITSRRVPFLTSHSTSGTRSSLAEFARMPINIPPGIFGNRETSEIEKSPKEKSAKGNSSRMRCCCPLRSVLAAALRPRGKRAACRAF